MKPRPRWKTLDWVELGLVQLARLGPPGLTIESLCAEAQRTKGSFYHHFSEHAEFVTAVAELWHKRNTAALIAATGEGSATSRLQQLNHLAVRLDAATELAMRDLAAIDRQVRAVVRRVDVARIEYLTDLHANVGSHDRSSCRELARIEYAAFVGAQMLWPDAAPEELEALGHRLAKLIDA